MLDSNFGIYLEIFGFILFLPQTRSFLLDYDFLYRLTENWSRYQQTIKTEQFKQSNPNHKEKTKKEHFWQGIKSQIIGILFDKNSFYEGRIKNLASRQTANEIIRFISIGFIVFGLSLQLM